MRRAFLLVVLALLVAAVGCQSSGDSFKEATRELVVSADNLAVENEAIVEQLVLDRASVTEDQEVTAIRNARMIKTITGAIRKVVE